MKVLKNGKLIDVVPAECVMVSSQSDLADIKNQCEAGTIAFTAGFKKIWQLDSNNQWQEIKAAEE